ncbi:hypothetical protein BGP_0546 [Beggiatoa sp. PS]|nr:hypothetical protein BGP_0546 [Beggiatoa sp. PS]
MDSNSKALNSNSKAKALNSNSKAKALNSNSKAKVLDSNSKAKALNSNSKAKALDSKPPKVFWSPKFILELVMKTWKITDCCIDFRAWQQFKGTY